MSRPPNGERPFFLIIAGANGSGKSSTYEGASVETDGRSVWIINPDLLTARIRDNEGLGQATANLQAVTRIEAWLRTSIEAYQTVGVETVLSTSKYRTLVTRAKALGFEFRFIYVFLDTPARNIERVRLRVSKGGHAVPEDKILARHGRSLREMPWFLEQADAAWFYDNSGATPRLVAKKVAGQMAVYETAPAFLRTAITSEPPA